MWSKNQKANVPSSAAPTAIDTLIGTQCRIQGDIFSQQSIKIDGQITGNVQAGGMVIVGENGTINGDIRSHELMVFGKVEGLVEVDKLQLKNTAHVAGNIRTKSLLVEEGAVYAGDIRMDQTSNASAIDKAKAPANKQAADNPAAAAKKEETK